MSLDRRQFLKGSMAAAGLAATAGSLPFAVQAAAAKPKVYFTKELSAESLLKMYRLVSADITGRIAVKVHTGEPNGPNILPRDWVKHFLAHVPNTTVVECNVMYESPRHTTEGHRKTLEINGWSAFTTVDIMDAEGEVNLPVHGGKWFTEVTFGSHILNYDSMVVLTHFKGHSSGGFGGSLKNISIGCASGKTGKAQLHREGNTPVARGPNFMERMAEGGKAVIDHFEHRMAYVNVLRNMSVDCDCAGTAAEPPVLPDLGILASTDILAIDKASVDMVYKLPEKVSAPMVERIESRSGLRQLSYMKELGMGSDDYELVEV